MVLSFEVRSGPKIIDYIPWKVVGEFQGHLWRNELQPLTCMCVEGMQHAKFTHLTRIWEDFGPLVRGDIRSTPGSVWILQIKRCWGDIVDLNLTLSLSKTEIVRKRIQDFYCEMYCVNECHRSHTYCNRAMTSKSLTFCQVKRLLKKSNDINETEILYLSFCHILREWRNLGWQKISGAPLFLSISPFDPLCAVPLSVFACLSVKLIFPLPSPYCLSYLFYVVPVWVFVQKR